MDCANSEGLYHAQGNNLYGPVGVPSGPVGVPSVPVGVPSGPVGLAGGPVGVPRIIGGGGGLSRPITRGRGKDALGCNSKPGIKSQQVGPSGQVVVSG